MTTITTVLVLLVSAAYWSDVSCFPSGAPGLACQSLTPLLAAHTDGPQTSSTSPYSVNLTALDDGNGGFAYIPGVSYSCMQY